MRVFERVVDVGGFAGAARALDLSPAVVTRLVADLEAHLGTRLLHRTTRRISLTDAGEAYLERVRRILEEVDEAEAAAQVHRRELAGVLRVLTTPVLATHVIAPRLAAFHARYPKIVLEVQVASAGESWPIEDHDITLIPGNLGLPADTPARRIVSTDAILVAAPAYLARRGAPAGPADLADHDFLQLRANGRRAGVLPLSREGEKVEAALRVAMSSNHIDTLVRAAQDGAGIALASSEIVAEPLASGALVHVLPGWVAERLDLYALLPSRRYLPERTRVFLDYLGEQTRTAQAQAAARGGTRGQRRE